MAWRDMFEKMNILPVVKAHYDTLSDYRTGRTSKEDMAIFFVVPALFGFVLSFVRFGFRIDAVNGFLNAFAILTGLLLNLLVLVFTISTTMTDRPDFQIRRRVLREVFANVCFCILTAVLVAVTALVSLAYMRSVQYAQTGRVATFLLSFLTTNFVLSLLMIIKRMYSLITSEFRATKPQRVA